MKAKWDIGLKGGAVVGNPIPEQYAMDPNYMNGIIDKAVAQANAEHIHGKAITPYLLAHIKDMTEGKSFAANLNWPTTTHTQPARSPLPIPNCNLHISQRARQSACPFFVMQAAAPQLYRSRYSCGLLPAYFRKMREKWLGEEKPR